MDWKSKLLTLFREAEKIVVLGIGKEERGDDGVGVYCIQRLRQEIKTTGGKKVKLIDGGQWPENFTSTIRKFRPSHVIIIDACLGKKEPGNIETIDPNQLVNNDFSSHRLSLKMVMDYIEKSIGSRVTLLGIQPEILTWNKGLSATVRKAAEDLVDFLIKNLSGWV